MLGTIIRYFSGPSNITREYAILNGIGVSICAGLYITSHYPLMSHLSLLGMRMRVASTSLMYRKSLKLSRSSLGQTAVGQIVNIMSNDMQRFDEFSLTSCYLIVAPLQTLIVFGILTQTIKISAVPGMIVLFLMIPFQFFMGKTFGKIRSKVAALTDKRVKFMKEIISGIRVIKMYNWEIPFVKRISEARK